MDELKKFSSNLTIIIKQRESQEEGLREKYKHKQKIQKIKSLLFE
jgi:hypothetical protein